MPTRSEKGNMPREAGEGCGVAQHSEECLCDVVIAFPIQSDRWYHPTEVWMGPAIARWLGVTQESGDAEMYEFMAQMIDAYDRTRVIADHDDKVPVGLRKKAHALVAQGHSMVDVPAMLGCEWSQLLMALTAGRASDVWTMTENDWIDFEVWLMAHEDGVPVRQTCERFGMKRSFVLHLCEAYGVPTVKRFAPDVCENESA
jgi:hypothetical protein